MWLQNEVKKDQESLEREKKDFIQQIKKIKKEELLPVKKEKLSLWQRIKTVLKIH
jgi:hypothetical protein